MEAFSLLKYWRGSGGGGLGLGETTTSPTPNTTTTILAAAVTESDNDNDDDDGPFFDLEFTAPDEVDASEEEEEESDGESEFKITLSPSSNERSDGNLSLSPSEDLFFKGKLVQVDEPSSFVLNNPSEPNSKPQFTSSLLKSATKLRVFMLGLKKPKPEQQQRPQRIKFKVEEVPIVSLFTRDNSSKGNNKSQPLNQKQSADDSHLPSEEKRFSKEVVLHKYLKMVKPLYVKVSRRYSHGDNNNKQGSKNTVEEVAAVTEVEGEVSAETTVKTQKQGNLPAGLRVVYKHLGKSRSASSTVAASPPAAVSSKRRDDSLLQQQDGIQGAILHCKRSFNAFRESECSSQLPRSVSDPLREISPELSRKSNDKRL